MRIEIKTEHNLNKQQTKEKLLSKIPLIQEQYTNELKNLVINWIDEDKFETEFDIMGMKFKGNGEIAENLLTSVLYLPPVASLFYIRIKNALSEKLKDILSN